MMNPFRRLFLTQTAAALAGIAPIATAPHLALLGDSVFDNGRYTNGAPDVAAQVRADLPKNWNSPLPASDAAATENIPSRLPGVHTMQPIWSSASAAIMPW